MVAVIGQFFPIFLDDLMQIVSRLDHSQDVDSSCRIAKQFLDFLELHTGDYRLNQVSSYGNVTYPKVATFNYTNTVV